MKKIARNLVVLGCAGSSAVAAPFLAIGDNAELFVTAGAMASYNDNILLQRDGAEEEDVIFTFRPGLDLQFGKDALLKGQVVAVGTLTSYSDNSELNNQLFGISSNASYDSGNLQLTGAASFNELDQPVIDVAGGTLVERNVTAARIDGELAVSKKFSVGAGFSYSNTDYRTAGYTDQWVYTVPVDVYYELTPKVDLSVGVRYTRIDLDRAGANQYDDFYYNVGARGAFTPKLSGRVSVGYNTRDVNVGRNPDGSFGADVGLTYAYSDKTRFNLSGGRNFTNASTGDSYENTNVTLSAVNAITVDWRLNASLTYRQLDYQTRNQKDDYVEGSLGATYIINEHFTAGLSYTFRDKSSDAGAPAEFQNNVVTLSVSARY